MSYDALVDKYVQYLCIDWKAKLKEYCGATPTGAVCVCVCVCGFVCVFLCVLVCA